MGNGVQDENNTHEDSVDGCILEDRKSSVQGEEKKEDTKDERRTSVSSINTDRKASVSSVKDDRKSSIGSLKDDRKASVASIKEERKASVGDKNEKNVENGTDEDSVDGCILED